MEDKDKTSLFDFSASKSDGSEVGLSIYKGKVCIVVNVASECGLTSENYEQLVILYKKYSDKGLEILAFPSNEFAGQEPKSNEEIQNFVCSRGGDFPVFAKTTVNGKNSNPIFKFLKKKLPGTLVNTIKWNFTKFLCDKNGTPFKRYAPTTTPMSMETDILTLLDESTKSDSSL